MLSPFNREQVKVAPLLILFNEGLPCAPWTHEAWTHYELTHLGEYNVLGKTQK